ncbi:MAG: cytochrome P450 [Geitlerinemataceae cyanobacterium]
MFPGSKYRNAASSNYEYLPFGGGNRLCIGYAFAQYEMKLVLATVLSQLQLQRADDRPVRSVRRGLTMSPSGGVSVVVVGRRERSTLRRPTI